MARAKGRQHRYEENAPPRASKPARVRTWALSGAAVGMLATLLGCGGNSGPKSGSQLCAPAGTSPRCPAGYTCQFDDHCWLNGTAPAPDGSVTDAKPTDGAISTPTDGRIPTPTDGRIPTPTDGGIPIPTDGGIPIPTDGAILVPTDGGIPVPTDGAIPTDGASAADVPAGQDRASNPVDLGLSTDAPSAGDLALRPDLPPPPDTAPPPPPVPAPAGRRMVPAGTVSRSAHYVAFRTLAQTPGSVVMQSAHYRAVRGIVGATQPK